MIYQHKPNYPADVLEKILFLMTEKMLYPNMGLLWRRKQPSIDTLCRHQERMATGISFTEVPPQQSHANLRKPTPKLELFVERTSNIQEEIPEKVKKQKTSHCHETQQISLPNYVKNTVEVLKL